jgi:hypothetical protein
VIGVRDYRGHGIHIEAVAAADGRWNAVSVTPATRLKAWTRGR